MDLQLGYVMFSVKKSTMPKWVLLCIWRNKRYKVIPVSKHHSMNVYGGHIFSTLTLDRT